MFTTKKSSADYGAPGLGRWRLRFFFRLPAKWAFSTAVLHPHQLFASASYDGVLRVCFSLSRYHTSWCFGRALFSSSRKRRLSHHYDKKSSRFTKEKEHRHIERLGVDRRGVLFFLVFCGLGVLDLLGAYIGQISRCGAGWQRHCAVFVVGESQ